MDAERVRRELWKGLNEINLSKALAVFVTTRGDLTSFVTTVAETIADESKPEPPEPPKTVLPDMSEAELGKPYRFIGDDGTEVEYWRDSTDDHLPWIVLSESGPDSHYWLSTNYFIAKFPYLGRLRRAVPGEVAE